MQRPRLLALVVATALSSACGMNEPSYYPAPNPVEVGGPAMGDPFATVELPFRPPTAEQQMALGEESERLGFSAPWLRTNRVGVSILYTVTNLGERTAQARLELDGASEFANYDVVALRAAQEAAALNNEDEVDILPLVGVRVVVEPGASVTGTIREDDLDEAALDLDALARFAAPPAAVLINASAKSRIGLDMLPANHLRPALFRIRLALVAVTGGHLRLSFVVRVRDEGNQLLTEGGDPFAPEPPTFEPPMMMPAP
ncbi:MAG TPA: hypothetical protein VGG33_20635 [Polyangia bacterium]